VHLPEGSRLQVAIQLLVHVENDLLVMIREPCAVHGARMQTLLDTPSLTRGPP
jgi:hypothetical protein